MSQYITLMGAEEVSSAGSRMVSAAHEMQSAASSFNYALEMHQRFLDDWLNRFEMAIDRLQNDKG